MRDARVRAAIFKIPFRPELYTKFIREIKNPPWWDYADIRARILGAMTGKPNSTPEATYLFDEIRKDKFPWWTYAEFSDLYLKKMRDPVLSSEGMSWTPLNDLEWWKVPEIRSLVLKAMKTSNKKQLGATLSSLAMPGWSSDQEVLREFISIFDKIPKKIPEQKKTFGSDRGSFSTLAQISDDQVIERKLLSGIRGLAYHGIEQGLPPEILVELIQTENDDLIKELVRNYILRGNYYQTPNGDLIIRALASRWKPELGNFNETFFGNSPWTRNDTLITLCKGIPSYSCLLRHSVKGAFSLSKASCEKNELLDKLE